MNQSETADYQYKTRTKSLRVEVASSTDLDSLLNQENILMIVDFSEETKLSQENPRLVSVGLNALGSGTSVEVWRGDGPVTFGSEGRIHWCQNDDLVIGHLMIDDLYSPNLNTLIESAYSEINTFLRQTPYSNVFRFWNYIPNINQIVDGVERYQSFCIGRHAAWSLKPDFEQALPAASAVGTKVPGLLISFAAGTNVTHQVENPRQVSAFHYPSAYGPKSPLFSRAVHVSWEGQGDSQLYVSGTASIVGHETRHAEDVIAQAEETSNNIDALLDCFANSVEKGFSPDSLRVYLRDPRQYEVVHQILSNRQSIEDKVIYLDADICRADLLLEIEGVYSDSN